MATPQDKKLLELYDMEDSLIHRIKTGSVVFPIDILRFNKASDSPKSPGSQDPLDKLILKVYKLARKELKITGYKHEPNRAPVVFIKTGAPDKDLMNRNLGDTPFCGVMTKLINENELLTKLLGIGDIVSNHQEEYRNEGYAVWNGKKAYLESEEEIDEYGYVPAEFRGIDDFPIRYWSNTIDHGRLVPVHGVDFKELKKNMISEEPFVSYFLRNDTIYYVIHDEGVCSRCSAKGIKKYLKDNVFFNYYDPNDGDVFEIVEECNKQKSSDLPEMTPDNVLLL